MRPGFAGKRKERSDVESNHSQKSPLIPVNDDFRYSFRIVLDYLKNMEVDVYLL